MDRSNFDKIKYDRLIEPYLEMYRYLFFHQGYKPLQINEMLEIEKAKLVNNPNLFVIPQMALCITTVCNLRCKDCVNGLPHIKNSRHLDVDAVIKHQDKLLSAVDSCVQLGIGAAEALLHPDLSKVLEHYLDHKKIGIVLITTNAVKLPPESLIPLMQNDKFILRVSDYRNLMDTSRLVEFLERNKIRFHLDNISMWTSPGGVEKRCKSEEELKREYARCFTGKYCKTLLGSRLYPCSRAAFLADSEYIPASSTMGLNIDDYDSTDALRLALLEFYLNDYTIACDYCDMNIDKPRNVIAGVQFGDSSLINKSECTLIKRNDLDGLRSYNDQLIEAKEYHEQQSEAWQQVAVKQENIIKDLQEWAHQLEEAKQYLEQQLSDYRQ